MGLNSCLYECSVMHHRLAPKEHHLNHNIFMFYLDLDEVDKVAKKLFLFSHNRRNFYAFRDGDHFPPEAKVVSSSSNKRDLRDGKPITRDDTAVSPSPGGERAGVREVVPSSNSSLRDNVLAYLARNDVEFDPQGRIMLLTLPRVLGYIFNPVSFYFCFDPMGGPVCAIAEVGNTFREMKLFLLRRNEMDLSGTYRKVTPKHFYVSPFSSLELKFDFKLKIPSDNLEIHIDDRDGDDRVLLSTLAGKRAALTNGRLAWFSLKYPLVTLKIIFLIHWHALLLYLKKVPFYRKAANPALQSDVLNPHPSLTGRAK
jgi:DUF1365 family protein